MNRRVLVFSGTKIEIKVGVAIFFLKSFITFVPDFTDENF